MRDDDLGIPPISPQPPSSPSPLERLRAFLGNGGGRVPPRPILVGVALALALWAGVRWVEHGFKSIGPGEAGLVLNRLTGKTSAVSTGSHFLPSAFYDLTRVRVSDQLLSGPPATFNVSTKDGFAVGLVLQARWAIDRTQLLSTYAGLPANPGAEVVGPVLASSFRAIAPEYDATSLLASKREELAARAATQAADRLKESGILLKDVLVGDLRMPPEFERGRLALLEEAQRVDRLEATLRLKKQEVEQQRLEAEARKVRSDKEAEAAANRRLIEAKAESDAMAYVLPLKEKAIRQQELEAEGVKARRLKEAETMAQTMKIQAEAEASRRRTMAEAEAYAIRQTSLAQFENLKREVELIEKNPTWVNKTLAEKLGDKVQVIVMPNLTADVLAKEAGRRVANGQPALASRAD
jgi:regulator of protease activity HflC (stomatin/prohibitin superfamily)